jgi:Cytosol aminopeptidase family, N-terminal domain
MHPGRSATTVQLRVVTDQPWDVKADVLVIPIALDPAFEGPLDELDRRAGGELRTLATFKELSGKRFRTTLASAGELPAGRVLAVGMGDLETLDREAVVRVAASAERRLGGRVVRSMAVWLSPIADAAGFDGDASLAGQLVARGVVEGSFDPRTIYRETVDSAPPVLDELILVVPGGDAAAVRAAAERGVIFGEGANTSPPRSSPRRRGSSPSAMASRSTSSAPNGPPSSGWACSWRSGAAATTRHG